MIVSIERGVEQGGKSPFSLLSEPISPSSLKFNFSFSPSSLLFPPISPSSQLYLGHFSLLPILFLPHQLIPLSVVDSQIVLFFGQDCCCSRDMKYIEDITRWREDMNFTFEWQEQYLTSSLRSLLRYWSCHE